MMFISEKDREYYKRLKELDKNIKRDGLGIKTRGNYPCVICGSYDKLYPIQTLYVCPSCFKNMHISPLVRFNSKPYLGSIYCPICGRKVAWHYIIRHSFVCMDCLEKMGRRQYQYNMKYRKKDK